MNRRLGTEQPACPLRSVGHSTVLPITGLDSCLLCCCVTHFGGRGHGEKRITRSSEKNRTAQPAGRVTLCLCRATALLPCQATHRPLDGGSGRLGVVIVVQRESGLLLRLGGGVDGRGCCGGRNVGGAKGALRGQTLLFSMPCTPQSTNCMPTADSPAKATALPVRICPPAPHLLWGCAGWPAPPAGRAPAGCWQARSPRSPAQTAGRMGGRGGQRVQQE